MNVAVVVPTIREPCISRWLANWISQIVDTNIIIVEDNPHKTMDLGPNGTHHYSWDEIEAELGEDAWIIPRRTDCVRSFGYWKAWQMGADVIATLDDDCYPNGGGWLEAHLRALGKKVKQKAWVHTIEGAKPRGVPYAGTARDAEVVVNHGLWSGIPDLDAVTQLTTSAKPICKKMVVPYGSYFPMCGMNLAWKREVTPAMYFLLMGKGYEYDRFGDIWCGVIVKKIADHLGKAVSSGDPIVHHERASDVFANLVKEAPGLGTNEWFWRVVDAIPLAGETWGECYLEVAEKLPLDGAYWEKVKSAMKIWAGLFEEGA